MEVVSARLPGRAKGSARRSAGARLAACGAAFAGAVLAVEAGLWIAGHEPIPLRRDGEPGLSLVVRESPHPFLTYDLRPGSRGIAWDTAVAINSHGFRDREYELVKPEGTARIVALGDSVTFGNGLAQDATWPEVLERSLAALGTERSFEVLNLGVAGYNTFEEVALLEHVGLRFDPDLVVVAYHVNDLGGTAISRETARGFARYTSPIYRSRLAQLLRVRLDRAGRVEEPAARDQGGFAEVAGDAELAELATSLRGLLAARGALHPYYSYLEWYTSPRRLGRLRFAFDRLAAIGRDRGFAVLVVLLPCLDGGGFDAEHELVHAIARHEAERSGFEVLELPELVSAARRESLVIDPWHPNERGHEFIAGAVLRRLRELGRLDAR